MELTANQLIQVTGSPGSNPGFSAIVDGQSNPVPQEGTGFAVFWVLSGVSSARSHRPVRL